jgi:hypothetical protein
LVRGKYSSPKRDDGKTGSFDALSRWSHLPPPRAVAADLRAEVNAGTFGRGVNWSEVITEAMLTGGKLRADAAKTSAEPEGWTVVSVPRQPELVDELWHLLQRQLAARLSPTLADQIDDSLGEMLMQWMGGYGAAEGRYRLRPDSLGNGRLEYEFSLQIPRDFKRDPVSVIGDRFGGLTASGTGEAAAVLNDPQWSFLFQVLDRAVSPQKDPN